MSSGACLTGHSNTLQNGDSGYRSYWLRSKLGTLVTRLGVTGAVVEMHHNTILPVGIYGTGTLCYSYPCRCLGRKGREKAMILLHFHCFIIRVRSICNRTGHSTSLYRLFHVSKEQTSYVDDFRLQSHEHRLWRGTTDQSNRLLGESYRKAAIR
jgi:hypothetical protein